ncbi:MAG: sigma-70 family RNA polymerase sigma factor [Planctomycetes bacterium]|nr:sigma-70 family RNA polymerase sigma factor [Planctomycetota bacterium]
MTSSPHTRPSLLVRIRDAADREAWRQFVDLYAPLVYRFARRRGLQDADAADLAQDVLHAVARSSERLEYDPRKGSFRGWLFTVARNKLHTFLRRRERQRRRTEDVAVDRLPDEPAAPESQEEALWEQEYQQRLFDWAAEQVRGHFQDRTWQAFWQTAVEGRSPREVAEALGLSVGAVYIAKSRVLARLKEQVQIMQLE